MRRVVAVLLLGGVLGLGAGACGSDTGDAADERAAPALHAEITRSRLFELQQRLKLVLRNDDAEPVDVDALQLDLPYFETVDPQERHSTLVPGRAVAIPVDFGEARCPPATGDGDDPAVVLTIAGEEQRVPLVEPSDALSVLNQRQCQEQAVRDAFAITWGADLTPAGELAVATTLDVERLQPDHALDIELVRSSVVVNLAAAGGGHPGLAVGPDDDRASVDVVFNTSRCDAHALTESKKTFIFVAELRLDDGPVIPLELPAEGPLRAQLEEYLEACH